MRNTFSYIVGICLVSILCLASAAGQTVTASITGTVTDPSGAVVPGAKVVAENVATGVKTSAQTNSDGVYTLRFLPIGTYTVTM
ncbi:MAG TPA: carboxypeptidase-like regulatory domain-containing protein, partial [Nitrospira sp.]|nr:carboxypeptidase-like regulatory domain-containing protein [Nitrospira sp.]